MAEVAIDGQKFSLLEPPEKSSDLVKRQKASITGTLDIKKFVDHINNVGKFVQLAYNGVVGAGPAYADLQIKIYNIGCNITKIFDKSALTINSFQSTAEEVSVTLQTTYQFLLDGFEDVAIDTLQSLEGTAKEMIKIANELKNKIDDQEKETSQAIESTLKKKTSLMMEEKERIEKEKSDQKMVADELKKELDEAKKVKEKYEQKRDDELAKTSYSTSQKVAVGALTIFFPWAGLVVKSMQDSESKEAKEKAHMYQEIAKEKAEIEKENDKRHKEALEMMKAYTQQLEEMKNCSEEEFADKAVLALHHASGALKCISVIMMQASQFWAGIEEHCTQLAGQGDRGILVRSHITAMKEKDEQIKMKFWQSKGFVTQAVIYHARWIALRDVCAEHMPNIRDAREELYTYIRENPTCKEARERAAALAATLKGNLEKAIQEIDDKSKESDDQAM